MKDYEHKGKPLTRKIASDLILELFGGQAGIPRCRINEKVLELHLRRGGVSSPNAHTTIGTGLDSLRRANPPQAYNQPPSFWHINRAGVDTESPEYQLYIDRLLRRSKNVR